MKHISFRHLLWLLTMSVVSAFSGKVEAQDLTANRIRELGWTSDYASAVETARRDNKPLMVVFRCVP